ncbi:Nucleolar protein 12 [Sticta canariensis]|nr:Nucleolar protein 12 [Sticta canariensis]
MTKLKDHGVSVVNWGDKVASPSFTPRAFDPALTTLFATSLGPVKSAHKKLPKIRSIPNSTAEGSELHSLSGSKNDDSVSGTIIRNPRSVLQEEGDQYASGLGRESIGFLSRKRKRNNNNNDGLEGRYMHRLGRQEAKEDMKSHGERSSKRHMQNADIVTAELEETDSSLDSNDVMKEDDKERPDLEIPKHESLLSSEKDPDWGKASRTVFLANVSTTAIKSKSARRTLIDHLESFITSLPEQDVVHKVESLRFRSVAFSSNALPKKAAYVKKELMDSTMKSTNAYAVYSTKLAAKEAVNNLNGTIVLDRHLRVDGVAHPAKLDHRRCVFIGNLSFVNDESMINAEQDEENNRRPRKGKEPADAEEGLWRQFSNAGVVESVRVIRDKTTRVGKGFAYVQFKDENGVEKALLYHEKKFPPMLPRILRVTRAKSIKQSTTRNITHQVKNEASSQFAGIYQPRLPSEAQSLVSRAGRLFGRAGAAKLKISEHFNHHSNKRLNRIVKPMETIVFEGHRASRNQGKQSLRSGGPEKRQGKPRSRSSKRGAAFKASGGKKGTSR